MDLLWLGLRLRFEGRLAARAPWACGCYYESRPLSIAGLATLFGSVELSSAVRLLVVISEGALLVKFLTGESDWAGTLSEALSNCCAGCRSLSLSLCTALSSLACCASLSLSVSFLKNAFSKVKLFSILNSLKKTYLAEADL